MTQSGLGSFASALRIYAEAGRANTAALFALVVGDPLLSLAFTVATGLLVGSVPGALASRAVPVPPLVGVTTVLLVHGVVRAFIPSVTYLQVVRVGLRVQRRVLDAALGPRGIAHLEDPELADEVAIAMGRDWSVQQTVYSVAGLVTASIHTVGAALILMRFRWWAPILVVASMAIQYRWANRGASSVFRAGIELSSEDRRRAEYHRDLAMDAAAAKEIRVFGLPSWVSDRYTSYWHRAVAPVWSRRRRARLLAVVPLATTVASSAVVFAAIGRAAVSGQIGLTELAIYAQQVIALFALTAQYFDLSYLLGLGMKTTAHLTALPSRTTAGALTEGRASLDGLPLQGIRFEDVSFSYPQSSRPVFEGLTLDIHAGESTAIVGVNGAGKTTLVKLLCRLYDPVRGRVTVDSVDLRDADPDAWHERLAVIFQDFVRYELPLRENVGFRGHDDERVLALGRASSADLPASLPHGWDTVLSRAYTAGTDLSGGQWQKVALARALHATRAAGVLVLDEPTAALDVRAEADLFERFLELTQGLTTVLISHRFSTVRHADRICVLDAGRVTEDGSHDELVALGGTYARMFALQASQFAS